MSNHYFGINGRELVGRFLEDHYSYFRRCVMTQTTSIMIPLFNIMLIEFWLMILNHMARFKYVIIIELH